MSDVIFIGDAVSASGYRLAGAEVETPEPGAVAAALEAAATRAVLVLISARAARRVAPSVLEQYLRGLSPLVLVIPDMVSDRVELDMAVRARRTLGVEP